MLLAVWSEPVSGLESKAGAARTGLSKLMSQGLLEEIAVGPEQPHWRADDDGQPIGPRITRAGLEAIGIEPEGESVHDESASCAQGPIQPQKAAAPVGSPSAPRDGSKQALVIALLRRGEGASLDELATATGWLPHATRPPWTGLRKKGHALTREKREDGTSIYRIAGLEA